jgi:hypothetical protein
MPSSTVNSEGMMNRAVRSCAIWEGATAGASGAPGETGRAGLGLGLPKEEEE